MITQEPQQIFLSVPKFFNINETEETQYSKIKNLPIRKVQEKLDGSLITPILINGEIIAKSKASFESQQAKIAQNIIDSSSSLSFFILDCYANNFQPFFELIGPDNKHVIDYEERGLQENKLELIMVRDQEGHFIDVNKFNYEHTVPNFNMTWEELLEKQKNQKGVEGWVVKYGEGKNTNILKVKTKEFFELHKIHEESDSYKIILKRILDEDMDDILSIVPDNKRIKLLNIMEAVTNYVVSYVKEIENIIEEGRHKERKEFVQKYINHPYFNVIMQGIKKYSEISENSVKKILSEYLIKKYSKEKQAEKFIKDIM